MKYLKYICLIMFIITMIVIFTKAAAPADKSSTDSDNVTDIVVGTIDAITPSDESIVDKYGIDNIKEFIRKGIGHFGLFLVLGFFGIGTFYLFFKNKKIGLSIELITGLSVAIISEIIQIFAKDRGPSVKDALLDFSGYLTSTCLILGFIIIVLIIRKKRKQVVND